MTSSAVHISTSARSRLMSARSSCMRRTVLATENALSAGFISVCPHINGHDRVMTHHNCEVSTTIVCTQRLVTDLHTLHKSSVLTMLPFLVLVLLLLMPLALIALHLKTQSRLLCSLQRSQISLALLR
jgi:hypothetical protein